MKITQFDPLYPTNLGTGGTTIVASTGSNGGFGGDVVGTWGDLTVVGLSQQISLASNLTPNSIGDVLTIISTGSTPVARFAAASNSLTSDTVVVVASSGAAVDIDFSLGYTWDITLDANCTFTISNPPASGIIGLLLVILRQGGVGGFTVTWPASVQWPDTDGTDGGPAPTLWTVVGARDVVTLITEDGGTTYGGNHDSGSGGTSSPLTTKGDLYTFSTTNARLAVGSNGTTVIADSVETTGNRWSVNAPGGEILISDTPSTPLIFADLLQTDLQDDLLYGDM